MGEPWYWSPWVILWILGWLIIVVIHGINAVKHIIKFIKHQRSIKNVR